MAALVYPKERPLFGIAFAIALVFWLVLIGATFGVALIYVLLAFVAYLFVQSAFISYLKGTGVKITASQMPDLHERVKACAAKLNLNGVPDAYLIHGNGMFNAFATRFLGRNFIALYSDIVDAMADQPGAVNFYIGHELGHLQRKHLQYGPFLSPALILPLLGAAYSRAREYTCDRYGLACCESGEDAQRGLAALAAGASRWKTLNLAEYRAQVQATNGFWMSFHELTGDYPWLTKRVAAIGALAEQKPAEYPRRNPFAWVLALLVPRVPGAAGAGGLVSVMMVVAVVGILAAIAIPAYQDYVVRAAVAGSQSAAAPIQQKVQEFGFAKQRWPSAEDIGLLPVDPSYGPSVASITLGESGVLSVTLRGGPAVNGKTLEYTPAVVEDHLEWTCTSADFKQAVLGKHCQSLMDGAAPAAGAP